MGFASFLRNLTTSEFSRWLVFSIISVSVWEFGSRLYNAPFLLPAPSRILEEFLKNPALVLANAFITTQEIVVGFVLGSLIALVAAIVLMALPKFIEDFIFRLVTTLNSIPFVALASLVVVWIGVNGIASKVAIAALYAFFALVYHAHKGMLSTDTMKEELLSCYNASFLQRIRFLKLPFSLPIIFVSLKGSAMAAVNGAIVGVFAASGRSACCNARSRGWVLWQGEKMVGGGVGTLELSYQGILLTLSKSSNCSVHPHPRPFLPLTAAPSSLGRFSRAAGEGSLGRLQKSRIYCPKQL
jgi:ABC-type nitrate/sulfonate/bicarbonate transport system permease component